MKKTNFAANLAYLCETERSIAELARLIGINRQQFNKYKAGQHLPSRRNMSLIAAHFGVSVKDLHLAPAQFLRVYQRATSPLAGLVNASRNFADLTDSFSQTRHKLDDIFGIYFRYQASSIYKDRILRSIMCFFEKDHITQYFYIERFDNLDSNGKKAFGFRYHGACTFLDGKLYLADIEGDQQNECTFAILTPIARRPRQFFFGLASGVAASTSREAFATRVALQRIASLPLRPSHLRQASTLPFASSEIPTEVRAFLFPAPDGHPVMLRA